MDHLKETRIRRTNAQLFGFYKFWIRFQFVLQYLVFSCGSNCFVLALSTAFGRCFHSDRAICRFSK